MSAKRETITDRWDRDEQQKRKPARKARRWSDEDAGPEMYHIQRREARQERRAA